MVKVSVIVPVYNAAAYLAKCLDSIVQQTLEELEAVCINDGSTDGSAEILKEYAAKDARIRVIHQENAGYGRTMNVGIQAASGEYIGIVEPDDYIQPDMYRRLYGIAKKLDLDIIKADFYRFLKQGNTDKKEYIPLSRHAAYYGKVLSPAKHPEIFMFTMNTWTGIYKRKFLEEHGIRHQETPGAAYQDNGFWFQTFCLAEKVYFLDEPFYMYRGDNPASSVHSREKVYSICEEYDFMYHYLERNPELKKRYKDVFFAKKYHNYQFTLMRIGRSYTREFLVRFRQDFCKAQARGELSQRYFSKSDWYLLHRIMDDPEKYEKRHLRKGNICYKTGYYLENYGIRRTLAKMAEAVRKSGCCGQ